MSSFPTRYFGELEYSEDALIRAPLGIPGFEHETEFLLLQLPGQYPLVYLQSTKTPGVCFPALPAQVADSSYELEISEEDGSILGVGRSPGIGSEVLCLALLAATGEGTATANLMAPVVVHIHSRLAVQCLNAAGTYGCRESLEELVASS